MDWAQAFYITATLFMWGSIILLLILFGEIMRLARQTRRSIRKVGRAGTLAKYIIFKKLLGWMGGENNG